MTGKDNCIQSSKPCAAESEVLLSLSGVGMSWDGREILHNVSFDVHQGDFIAITGPNGGGKTTLLRILLGLLRPTCGTVMRNRDIRVGYLPQKNMIDSRFPISVHEVISSGLLALDMDKSERCRLYDETIRRVGLEAHAEQPIGQLSGGQLQRALLGRAIISHPRLLVMDEPLSYIDKHFEVQLYDLIRELARDTTIVLVSHEMTTIAGMANRHFIIDVELHECLAPHHYIHSDCDE